METLRTASPERQRREEERSRRSDSLQFGAADRQDGSVLRHVMGWTPFNWTGWGDVADHALRFVFRIYKWVMAFMAGLALVVMIRHGWPIKTFVAPFLVATVLFAFWGVTWMFCARYGASLERSLMPRGLEVFRDRTVVTMNGCQPTEFPNRRITLAWGVRGDDQYAWGVGRDRALILRYSGWKRLPRTRWHFHRGQSYWAFAITGTEEQLAEAHSRLIEVGIRPRTWSFVEILAMVLLAAALAFSLWRVW
jgi:hypothetical protein